jgi:hypothetical protein
MQVNAQRQIAETNFANDGLAQTARVALWARKTETPVASRWEWRVIVKRRARGVWAMCQRDAATGRS